MFKIDNREGKLKELFLASPSIECEFENLVYGDFQLGIKGAEAPTFIFERKTLEDLLASIKDGRYTNQKARLFEVFQPSQIFYIIEGSLGFGDAGGASGTKTKILQSSVINTMLRDKIACFFTKNVKDTFDLLNGIVRRFREDPAKYTSSAPAQVQIQVETSDRDTPTQVFKKILCQLPGASEKTAVAITEKWPTFAVMNQELQPLDEAGKCLVLNSIKMSVAGTGGGEVTTRKISKKVVDSVIKNLYT
jgi:ERCC4-type nuclease